MDILAQRLKEKRLEKKLSQEDIANRLHINRVTYTYWESARHTPKIEDLIKLADIYETSIDYLVGRYKS